jgi:hypothetical protein
MPVPARSHPRRASSLSPGFNFSPGSDTIYEVEPLNIIEASERPNCTLKVGGDGDGFCSPIGSFDTPRKLALLAAIKKRVTKFLRYLAREERRIGERGRREVRAPVGQNSASFSMRTSESTSVDLKCHVA